MSPQRSYEPKGDECSSHGTGHRQDGNTPIGRWDLISLPRNPAPFPSRIQLFLDGTHYGRQWDGLVSKANERPQHAGAGNPPAKRIRAGLRQLRQGGRILCGQRKGVNMQRLWWVGGWRALFGGLFLRGWHEDLYNSKVEGRRGGSGRGTFHP
jgi:hypothetical protein